MERATCTERLPGVAGDVERAPYIEALRRYICRARSAVLYRVPRCAASGQSTHRGLLPRCPEAVRALARLEAPDTKLRQSRAPDALTQFLQAL